MNILFRPRFHDIFGNIIVNYDFKNKNYQTILLFAGESEFDFVHKFNLTKAHDAKT